MQKSVRKLRMLTVNSMTLQIFKILQSIVISHHLIQTYFPNESELAIIQ